VTRPAFHNAADALTALPLGLAFTLGRRPTARRYAYGYGRAEDLAGVAVLAVAASADTAEWCI
jgi:divalent metal cation (Fe/Co/Zn/Cd) transporter